MSGKRPPPAKRNSNEVRLRRIPDEKAWELLHPRCALDRSLDMEEVDAMIAAEESEIAIDELRWLLGGCPNFIHAHRVLGDLALAEGDVPLARGHFGHAYRAGAAAVGKRGKVGPLPYARAANQDFYLCGQGLIQCLRKLDKPQMADEVVEQLLQFDPTDPLGLRGA